MRKVPLPAADTGPPPRNTPERLIDAVEELLSQRDDLDLSLRDITAAAGANLAAVNYHFGSKDALMTAVIERALREHARRQLLALRAVAAAPAASIEDVVRAWIGPSVRPARDGRAGLIPRIAARVLSDGSPGLRELGVTTHAETYALVFRLLADRLPAISSEELTLRITLAAVGVAGIVAGTFDDAVLAGNPVRWNEGAFGQAVGFIAAGLAAPPTLPRVAPG
jgi:AcrR family transcriptional regulator